jgi:hypothetical protein
VAPRRADHGRLSRTTGLPGFHESEWELSGVVALALEAGFVAAVVAALAPAGAGPHARTAGEDRFSRAQAGSRAGSERRSRAGA